MVFCFCHHILCFKNNLGNESNQDNYTSFSVSVPQAPPPSSPSTSPTLSSSAPSLLPNRRHPLLLHLSPSPPLHQQPRRSSAFVFPLPSPFSNISTSVVDHQFSSTKARQNSVPADVATETEVAVQLRLHWIGFLFKIELANRSYFHDQQQSCYFSKQHFFEATFV